MKLISWNVNGIRAVAKKGFLDWFLKEEPDVLCLQETKAEEPQVPEEIKNVPGYHVYFSHSKMRKGYSGVAVYTKEKPIEVKEAFNGKKNHPLDMEGRVLILKFKKFTLLNVYFPNGKARKERFDYKMDFYKSFLKYINKLRKNGEKIIFCGDVNTAHKEIDLARPGPNSKVSGFLPEERAWIDSVIENGYIDTFREFNDKSDQYSWWDMQTRARDRNVGWRIDYFFADKSLKKKFKDAYILSDVMGSDHAPVVLEISL